ncbi:hypothetical protein ACL02S_22760 [Nocardia sp. 004]|uniref:hypothetical protein n=1 Tax=Nocardia sp. 004 TaxID=3385978 RepID=UPI00399F83AC
MALNLKLGPRRQIEDDSAWGRSWVGWEPGQSARDTYDNNRGVWNLDPRVTKERYATFSVDGTIIAVVEIDHIEDVPIRGGGMKQAVVGRVLEPGDAGHDLLIDRTVDDHRNPVTYIPDDQFTYAWDYSARVSGGRTHLPRHDQNTDHDRPVSTVSTVSTVNIIDWFGIDWLDEENIERYVTEARQLWEMVQRS